MAGGAQGQPSYSLEQRRKVLPYKNQTTSSGSSRASARQACRIARAAALELSSSRRRRSPPTAWIRAQSFRASPPGSSGQADAVERPPAAAAQDGAEHERIYVADDARIIMPCAGESAQSRAFREAGGDLHAPGANQPETTEDGAVTRRAATRLGRTNFCPALCRGSRRSAIDRHYGP